MEALIALVVVGGIGLALDGAIQARSRRRDLVQKLAQAKWQLAGAEGFQPTLEAVKANKSGATSTVTAIAIDENRDKIAVTGPEASVLDRFLSGALSRQQLDKAIAESSLRDAARSYLRRTIDCFDRPEKINGAALRRFIESQDRSCSLISEGLQTRIIEFSELIESEVLSDGRSVTKTARAAGNGEGDTGGMNTIIERLSRSGPADRKAEGVRLKITISDIDDPVHEIDFADSARHPATPLETALREAVQWHDLLSLIIHRTTAEQGAMRQGQKAGASPPAKEIARVSNRHPRSRDFDHAFDAAKSRLTA